MVDQIYVEAPALEIDVDVGAKYWALEEDPAQLASMLIEKVRAYQSFMRTSAYWSWAMRNWRYYHNLYFADAADDGQAIRQLGPSGETVGFATNHVGNIGRHLLNLTTRRHISTKTRAVNADLKSLKQAMIGDNWLNYRRTECGIETQLERVAAHALVLLEGFLFGMWDQNEGEPIVEAEFGGAPLRNGEVVWHTPTGFDVVRDPSVKDWERKNWVMVRTWENKWDLAARIEDPELRARVSGYTRSSTADPDDEWGRIRDFDLMTASSEFEDVIGVWHFIHRDCDGCPGGRYFRFIDADLQLVSPGPNPYVGYGDDIPLYRMSAGEFLMTQFGYSPLLDIHAPQEMLNTELSSIATNHVTCGIQHIWCGEDSDYDESKLSSGVILVKGKEPAKGINLTATPPEYFNMLKYLEGQIEKLSGVNAVTRGEPQANLDSGKALQVMDARTVEFADPLVKSYNRLVAQWGTFELRCLRDFMAEDDVRFLVASNETSQFHRAMFRKSDLETIDRVVVETGNPLLDTLAGRIQVAEFLMEKAQLQPQEFLTLIGTGQFKPMARSAQATLDLIHAENEALRDGSPVAAAATDNHILHVQEHSAELNSPEARLDQMLSGMVLAHVMEHINLLQFMGVQMLQMAMGYPVPFPATVPGLPPAMTGGVQPQGQAPPGTSGGPPAVPPVPQMSSPGGTPSAHEARQSPPVEGGGGFLS